MGVDFVPKILLILEVSQKQAYIFESRRLAENIRRSGEIAYVTSTDFFNSMPSFQEENLVYTGGGHTVLQFTDEVSAKTFSYDISRKVLEVYPDMELFIAIHPYNDHQTPGENLNALSQKLEQKKSLRAASFHLRRFGFEKPAFHHQGEYTELEKHIPEGWEITADSDALLQGNGDNFLAVVHADGNSMGSRVQSIYESSGSDWNVCTEKLRAFSEAIDQQFAEAYTEMVDEMAAALAENPNWKGRTLPIRKLIGAGDDVCFVTGSSLALECASVFLQKLESKVNPVDKQRYTACAGVVLIHKKFPFRKAYDLSEALCSNAKKTCAAYGGNLSALDWHIEFGQMKDSLTAIRTDYVCADGSCMTLRPYLMSQKEGVPVERSFAFYKAAAEAMRSGVLPKGKMKQLRTAFQSGVLRSKRTIAEMQIAVPLASVFRGPYLSVALHNFKGSYRIPGLELDVDLRDSGFCLATGEIEAHQNPRCLYFDAIEMVDHSFPWRGEC